MFEIVQNRRVLYGPGSSAEIGGILKDMDAGRLFILAYNKGAAMVENIQKFASQAGVDTLVSDIVQDEPELLEIDQVALMIKEHKSEAVLAVGGGSVMDAAKAAAMIASNGGTAEEYQMQNREITKPSVPVIMLPTTAGTGSEANKTSVIRNESSKLKKSIYSPYMVAETVILDPEATLELPSNVTAFTGIDALSHAVESYASLNANPYTQMYGLKAVELIGKSLVTAVRDGKNIQARADMLYASYFAGCSLNAGIGLAHIIAQPIGGLFNIPHGEACSIFLPYAIEYNAEISAKEYRDIGKALGIQSGEGTLEKIREIIGEVKTATDIKPYVHKMGVQFNDTVLDETVQTVMQATGHIKCNPRVVDEAIIRQVIARVI